MSSGFLSAVAAAQPGRRAQLRHPVIRTMASVALLLAAGGGVSQVLAAEAAAGDVSPVSAAEAAARDAGAVDTVADAADASTLATVTVVGDWLGDADEKNVQDHPGARDVVRREQLQQQGLTTVRQALNRIPGVNAPENNGTGSHDMALNFGIRGLNPRLATRSTLLMDGIPVPLSTPIEN